VEIGARVDGDRVAFVVRDHGIGIPSRDLERIFERFYRVDRARSRETGGTGLGLAIVRHVAQAHGGEVTVQSIEGEGSMFTLFVPAAKGTATSTRSDEGSDDLTLDKLLREAG
jgi:two-component system sensor histidine kinase SenX3